MGPLAGIRVIELAGLGPGPFAAMMLADMGADVIRVDRVSAAPGGLGPELLANASLNPINRGRRSIAVDLRRPEGVEVVLRLIDRSDGLIEGFRPGVTERLGLGPDTCLARNPRLVYGRMTGWGQQGPLSSDVGHDITYIAIAGALANFAREGEPPSAPLNLVGDYGGGGMLLAFGMACGLVEALRSGQGQVLDAAMIDGVAAQLANVMGRAAQGQWSGPPGTNHVDGGSHWYGVYETSDGRYMAVGALETKFYRAFVETLGLDPELTPQWDRTRWRELKTVVAAKFRERTRDDWEAAFAGVEACVAPVLTIAEAVVHPHNVSRDVFVTRDGVAQPAPAPRFDRTRPVMGAPPPDTGQDTVAVLAEAGFSAAEVAELLTAGIVASAAHGTSLDESTGNR